MRYSSDEIEVIQGRRRMYTGESQRQAAYMLFAGRGSNGISSLRTHASIYAAVRRVDRSAGRVPATASR